MLFKNSNHTNGILSIQMPRSWFISSQWKMLPKNSNHANDIPCSQIPRSWFISSREKMLLKNSNHSNDIPCSPTPTGGEIGLIRQENQLRPLLTSQNFQRKHKNHGKSDELKRFPPLGPAGGSGESSP
jgi:hypothetical protein